MLDAKTARPNGPRLAGHATWVTGVAFSPDGRTLASTSYDTSTILWDLATRQRIGEPLRADFGPQWTPAFSEDGQHLLTGTVARRAFLWDIDPDSWVRRACTLAARNLTRAEFAEYLPGNRYHATCAQWPAGA
jgi:WD40 repeat protein